MKVLGVVLAGGRSSRFGSDKALAVIEGQSMLDRIRAQLGEQVNEVVAAGREVPDQPAPGLGPLGGLAGGLMYARDRGFDSVLSTGCDLPELPPGLVALLSPAPAVVLGQQLLRIVADRPSGGLAGLCAAAGQALHPRLGRAC